MIWYIHQLFWKLQWQIICKYVIVEGYLQVRLSVIKIVYSYILLEYYPGGSNLKVWLHPITVQGDKIGQGLMIMWHTLSGNVFWQNNKRA